MFQKVSLKGLQKLENKNFRFTTPKVYKIRGQDCHNQYNNVTHFYAR